MTQTKCSADSIRAGEVISALSLEGTVSHDSSRAHPVVVKALSGACSHLEGSENEDVPEKQEISPSRLALSNLLLPNVPQQPKTEPPSREQVLKHMSLWVGTFPPN